MKLSPSRHDTEVGGHCRSARTLINRKTPSPDYKHRQNDQPKRRHDQRQNMNTLERNPNQRDVADEEKKRLLDEMRPDGETCPECGQTIE